MFAGHSGLEIMLDSQCQSSRLEDVLDALFNEELGAAFQIHQRDEIKSRQCFPSSGPSLEPIKKIGRVPANRSMQDLRIYHSTALV